MRQASNHKGEIVEVLRDARYRVQLEDGREIVCYLAGRLKVLRVSMLIGDTVHVYWGGQEGSVGRIQSKENRK